VGKQAQTKTGWWHFVMGTVELSQESVRNPTLSMVNRPGTGVGTANEGPLDDNIDFSDPVWQAPVCCPYKRVDAPGSDAKRLEDKTAEAENMALE